MRKSVVRVAGVLVLLAASSSALAANILWFEDGDVGTSAVGGGIALTGNSSTFTNNTTTFNTLLAGGTWDLVIYGEQNNTVFGSNSATLTAYVAGGGKVIGATWVNGGLATLLQGSASTTNVTSITTTAHPIFAGLGPTIGLTNPGWGTFSQTYNPVGGATGLGTTTGAFGVILGNGGRTLLDAPLFDTYSTLSQGQRFIANEINFLVATPEPATVGLFGLAGAAGLVGLMRRRSAAKRKPSA